MKYIILLILFVSCKGKEKNTSRSPLNTITIGSDTVRYYHGVNNEYTFSVTETEPKDDTIWGINGITIIHEIPNYRNIIHDTVYIPIYIHDTIWKTKIKYKPFKMIVDGDIAWDTTRFFSFDTVNIDSPFHLIKVIKKL